MKSISNTSLFSNLSPEAANQTKGGHWVHSHCYCSYGYATKVRVRYYTSGRTIGRSGGSIVNIYNSDLDDTAISVSS